jgi:hypothetical protein
LQENLVFFAFSHTITVVPLLTLHLLRARD